MANPLCGYGRILWELRPGLLFPVPESSLRFPDGRPLPKRQRLAIVEDSGDHGVLLLHLSEANEEFADTWHESDDHAKDQAAFELGVPPDGWVRP